MSSAHWNRSFNSYSFPPQNLSLCELLSVNSSLSLSLSFEPKREEERSFYKQKEAGKEQSKDKIASRGKENESPFPLFQHKVQMDLNEP